MPFCNEQIEGKSNVMSESDADKKVNLMCHGTLIYRIVTLRRRIVFSEEITTNCVYVLLYNAL